MYVVATCTQQSALYTVCANHGLSHPIALGTDTFGQLRLAATCSLTEGSHADRFINFLAPSLLAVFFCSMSKSTVTTCTWCVNGWPLPPPPRSVLIAEKGEGL